MQLKKAMLLSMLVFLYIVPQCVDPIPGTPVWTLAAEALKKMCTIESKVSDVESVIDEDFSGTFTVYDLIFEKACINQTLAESIDSAFDEIEIELPEIISKLCAIESKLVPLESGLETIDSMNDGIFSALDSLSTTLCSKIEQISDELTQVQSTIESITQREIEHTQTILSKLDHLDDQVIELNSALDAINIDVGVSDLDSCTDVLVSLADDLVVDICNLEIGVENGFAGTFTALDAQLSKSDDLVSLVDIADPIPMVDFSGVFTALDELDEKVCTMESLVDIVCLINTNDILCTAGSKIDIALEKICTAESLMDPLTSIADEVISELDVIDMLAVQDVCSNIEEATSKLGLIESKIDQINAELDTLQIQENSSKLEIIERNLLSVCSKLDQVDVMDSKLCLVDSKVGVLNKAALTIESVVDVVNSQANVIDSKVDEILSVALTIESKVCNIENDTLTICSNLDELIDTLSTVESKLDNISGVEKVFIIESEVNALCSKLELTSLNSKLDLIESIVCTIESDLDIVGSLIGEVNMKAIDLEGDFGQTWTILDTIENKLCTSESVLETVDSKLGALDVLSDFAGVYTVIESILLKECTVDSKTDIAVSLADIFASNQGSDISGIYTALDTLLEKVCTIDSQVDQLAPSVTQLKDALGTPIFSSDLPKTIDTSGRYYFAEPLIYTPSATNTNAITITTNNVTIDLNNYSLTQASGLANTKGIVVNSGLDNIWIMNGFIFELTDQVISINSDCSHILLDQLNIDSIGVSGGSGFMGENPIAFDVGCSQSIIRNCLISNSIDDLIGLFGSDASSCVDFVIDHCHLIGSTGASGVTCRGTERAILKNLQAKANDTFGLLFDDASNNVCLNCIVLESGSIGIDSQGSPGFFCMHNVVEGGGSSGIRLQSSPSSVCANNSILNNSSFGIRCQSFAQANTFFAFNACIENSTNIRASAGSGANTFLGNFALNSTAAGNPDNSNYDIDGSSNITGKFSTVSQTSSFVDRPTRWTNINMIP